MDTPANFQLRVRRQLREDVMDAAYRILVTSGWSSVRMTAIAEAVGVSRQTLYKEFTTKDEIGRALTLREAGRFIDRINGEIEQATDLSTVIETAIRCGFEHGSANRILLALLTEPPLTGDSLLPFVTTDAAALFDKGAELLAGPIRRHAPGIDPEDIAATCDALTRLMISHLLQPSGDTETTIRRLVRLAHRNLGLIPNTHTAPDHQPP